MTFKFYKETISTDSLYILKERCLSLLKKGNYIINKETYNTISFDNGLGLSRDRNLKLFRGTFFFYEKKGKVRVEFTYEVLYLNLIHGLLIIPMAGYFIDANFYYLTGLIILFYPIEYMILKYEAQEFIDDIGKL